MNEELNKAYGHGPGVEELQAEAVKLRGQLLKQQAQGATTDFLEAQRLEGLADLEQRYSDRVAEAVQKFEVQVDDLKTLYTEKLTRKGVDELAAVAKYERQYKLKTDEELEAEAGQVIRGEKFFPDISEAEVFLLEIRGRKPKLLDVTRKAMDAATWQEPWRRLITKDHRSLAEGLKNRLPGQYVTLAVSPSAGTSAVMSRFIKDLVPPLWPDEWKRNMAAQREADRERVLLQKFQK